MRAPTRFACATSVPPRTQRPGEWSFWAYGSPSLNTGQRSGDHRERLGGDREPGVARSQICLDMIGFWCVTATQLVENTRLELGARASRLFPCILPAEQRCRLPGVNARAPLKAPPPLSSATLSLVSRVLTPGLR